MIALLKLLLERAEFLQLNELVLNVLHYLLVLSVLIKIRYFLILFLLPHQVSVHIDLLADYLLQFLIHLNEVLGCFEFEYIVPLVRADEESSKITRLLDHHIASF